ncbi:hypothetical protein A9507_01870 [Methanobacterium sp. A39]|uniref:Uncharacterized protein n=1 Tax=Methanobacterium bryantii TaxID=2161 RepID=A0A2A2H6E3_METBR|nr:hypothetical protein A9507_01870 [Methanobacterium sp. A39]PAV04833.1 hypothetical protein ASJ80_11015 [Methanobacterium bryantii]
MKKYESKISIILIQIILIISGILLLFNFLFSFLSSKSTLDLYFFLPLFIILVGIFLNGIYLSKKFFIACLSIILFQVVVWILFYLYLPFKLSIEFYTQVGSVIFILLLVVYAKNRGKFLK